MKLVYTHRTKGARGQASILGTRMRGAVSELSYMICYTTVQSHCFQNLEGAAVGQRGRRLGFRPARGGGRGGRLDLPWSWPLLVGSLSATEFPPQSSHFLHDLLHQNSNRQQPCSRLGSRVRLSARVFTGCSVWDGHMWAAHPGPCLSSPGCHG